MLKTTNQRLAALVLAGAAISLVALLLLFFTMPFLDADLLWVWSFANTLVSQLLLAQGRQEFDPFIARFTAGAIALVVASWLTYGLGLLLALRVLGQGWRERQRRQPRLTLRRFTAALTLLCAALSGGALLWYMDFYNLDAIRAWADIRFIVNSQHYLSSVVNLDQFADFQIRVANTTLTLWAFSYLLCLALAVATLQRRVRARHRKAQRMKRR